MDEEKSGIRNPKSQVEAAPRFIADDMLGRLARWLRIIGYDVTYYPAIRDVDLANEALREDRVILTRDGELVKRRLVEKHILIRDDNYLNQLTEVVQALNLGIDPEIFFTRCLDCNSLIEEVQKSAVRGKVPPYVYRTRQSFHRCPECKKIYWSGTHIEHIKRTLAEYIP